MRTEARRYPSWPGATLPNGPDTLKQTASHHQCEATCDRERAIHFKNRLGGIVLGAAALDVRVWEESCMGGRINMMQFLINSLPLLRKYFYSKSKVGVLRTDQVRYISSLPVESQYRVCTYEFVPAPFLGVIVGDTKLPPAKEWSQLTGDARRFCAARWAAALPGDWQVIFVCSLQACAAHLSPRWPVI